jgi:hypothetical protein
MIDNNTIQFKRIYEPVQDPGEKISRWYTRIPRYYELSSSLVDFTKDVPLDIGMSSGLMWDLTVSIDSTD